MSDAIRIDHVSKSFGRTKALDDVGFTVPAGSIYGLLGPNGAGKTTLFSIAAGFLAADSGSLQVLGTDIQNVSQLQGRMTILPQDAAFQRNVPILEQLLFLRRLDGSSRATAEREVDEALAMVGLAQYRKRGIHALSHGMLKRMGIAQAFLGQPEVILLDEPTSGLDPQNAKQIRDLIRAMQRSRGATTVISSHNLAEIQELCDHVAILDHGRLVAAGPIADITRTGRTLDVVLAQPPLPEQKQQLGVLPHVGGVEVLGPRRLRLQLAVPAGQEPAAVVARTMRAVLDLGLQPQSMVEGNSLEEFFLAVTGGDVGSAAAATTA